MFKKILIATDLCESSNAVINCMKDFKSLGVEEVILFYACGVTHLNTIAETIKQSIEPYLKAQQKLIEAQGFKTTLEIVPGIPSEEIKLVAKQRDVSLIVIGSEVEGSVGHLLSRLGSITYEVLHSHEKPLLMVRNKIVEREGDKTTEGLCKNMKDRILYSTDFSDNAMRAYLYVEKLVEDGCKKVTLLHVQDKVKIEKHLFDKLKEFNTIDTERLEMFKKQLISKGAQEVEIKIVYGIPAKEILDEAKNGYSLIVMGSQGRGFFHEIFIGSVSHNVARSADVSLLLIPSVDR